MHQMPSPCFSLTYLILCPLLDFTNLFLILLPQAPLCDTPLSQYQTPEHKKAWEPLSSVPLSEAFALPYPVEQTTLEPTPIWIRFPTWSTIFLFIKIGIILHWLWHNHTRRHLPLLSSWQDNEIAKFQIVMNKVSSKRLQYVVDYFPTQVRFA